jgi:acyl-CoA reductase-like NAD-dependent aldehyde dehydrogenase
MQGNVLNYTTRQAMGVVALITPWNHPLLITIKKLAPALAAGNSIILKPSEKAPLSVQYLVQSILPRAALPPGTVQVLIGGADVAQQVVSDERIARVDFTGGTRAGKILAGIAGTNLVPVTAELGGKSAVCVLPQVNVNDVVEGILAAGFIASGQTCVTGSRVIIHKDVYDEVLERLVLRTGELKVGLPWESETQIGALINEEAVERCELFVRVAKEEGARILTGGERTSVNHAVRTLSSTADIGILLPTDDNSRLYPV